MDYTDKIGYVYKVPIILLRRILVLFIEPRVSGVVDYNSPLTVFSETFIDTAIYDILY